MPKFIFAFVFLFLNVSHIESARILAVFPTPSISHQFVFRSLIKGLVDRGHEVTVITTDPAYPAGQAPSNLKEIDVHDISYKIWREELSKTSVGKKDDLYSQMKILMRAIIQLVKEQLQNEEVKDIINKRTGEYDLLLLEAYVQPILIFSHIFKIPVIHVSSLGAMEFNLNVVGIPSHPLLYPSPIRQKLYNLTKFEKIQSVYQHVSYESIFEKMEKELDSELKNIFGSNTPTIRELANNVDMLFLNVHPIWIDNQPMPPSAIYIGGIHKTPPKELPKDLKNYLDNSKNGVIYFSLGTNVNPSLLPPEKIQTFLNVFSQLPYDVMWKWNNDELPGLSKNIRIFKWLPQSDLLRHPKVKLFIIQGGLQSTDEAIDAGVPLIGIPMLGDQWYNVEKYVRHNIGLRLELGSLTEKSFKGAINTVIDDKSYRENIIKLRTIMEDAPQSPLERAVWWTEYVLRHGGAKHLRAAGANITWAQYLELDIVLILAVGSITILILVLYAISRLLNTLRMYKANIKIKMS